MTVAAPDESHASHPNPFLQLFATIAQYHTGGAASCKNCSPSFWDHLLFKQRSTERKHNLCRLGQKRWRQRVLRPSRGCLHEATVCDWWFWVNLHLRSSGREI